jgi:molybdate transport system regulatory protein
VDVRAAGGRKTATWRFKPRRRFVSGGTIGLGPGKADLLEAVEATGSISAAGKSLGMSYRRAWMLIATMNASFATPLVMTFARRSTGAVLTPEGRKVLQLYRRIESRSLAAASRDTKALLRLLSGH